MICCITKEALQQVYSKDLSLYDIAAKLGCSHETARKYLTRYNFDIAKRGRPKGGMYVRIKEFVDRDNRIVKLRKQGKTLAEIGIEFGISRERVRQILLRNGIKGWRPKKVKSIEYHPCECGCNTPVAVPRQYVQGHYRQRRHLQFWVERGATPELVKQLYNAGDTIDELAERFTASYASMRRYMEEYSIPRMAGIPKAISRGTIKASGITYEKLYELYIEEHLPGHKVAEKLDVCEGTVYSRLAKYGIPRRHTHKTIQYDISYKALFQLYIIEGLSVVTIKKKFGCSNSVIYNRLRRYGIPLRKIGKHGKVKKARIT